ncbi:MAG: hypothetical protein V7K98_07935 [Nostoc sp.]|uniref:hypothetical protein n=1 Tax=Nostoc sp. TaxID=1180 RepID=UPI002FF50E03
MLGCDRRVVILRIGRGGLTGNYVADDDGVAASPLLATAIAQQGIFRYGCNGFWLVITIDFGIVHQLVEATYVFWLDR